jgi:hypothetical protein
VTVRSRPSAGIDSIGTFPSPSRIVSREAVIPQAAVSARAIGNVVSCAIAPSGCRHASVVRAGFSIVMHAPKVAGIAVSWAHTAEPSRPPLSSKYAVMPVPSRMSPPPPLPPGIGTIGNPVGHPVIAEPGERWRGVDTPFLRV